MGVNDRNDIGPGEDWLGYGDSLIVGGGGGLVSCKSIVNPPCLLGSGLGSRRGGTNSSSPRLLLPMLPRRPLLIIDMLALDPAERESEVGEVG